MQGRGSNQVHGHGEQPLSATQEAGTSAWTSASGARQTHLRLRDSLSLPCSARDPLQPGFRSQSPSLPSHCPSSAQVTHDTGAWLSSLGCSMPIGGQSRRPGSPGSSLHGREQSSGPGGPHPGERAWSPAPGVGGGACLLPPGAAGECGFPSQGRGSRRRGARPPPAPLGECG